MVSPMNGLKVILLTFTSRTDTAAAVTDHYLQLCCILFGFYLAFFLCFSFTREKKTHKIKRSTTKNPKMVHRLPVKQNHFESDPQYEMELIKTHVRLISSNGHWCVLFAACFFLLLLFILLYFPFLLSSQTFSLIHKNWNVMPGFGIWFAFIYRSWVVVFFLFSVCFGFVLRWLSELDGVEFSRNWCFNYCCVFVRIFLLFLFEPCLDENGA